MRLLILLATLHVISALTALCAPEEVTENVRRMIEEVGAGGGYALGPCHDVLADATVENVVAMIEEAQSQ
jgi:uroporphyrinogen-III decarboxylase